MADREKVIKKFEEAIPSPTMEYALVPAKLYSEVLELLKEQPERKHGHWTMNSDAPDRLICSECNSQFDVWHWESKQMHFCPCCGAKMEEEKR